MKPKFKVGEVVMYDRGEVAEKAGLARCVPVTIHAVTTEYREGEFVYKYTKPLYSIAWLPRGRATVPESQLQRTE